MTSGERALIFLETAAARNRLRSTLRHPGKLLKSLVLAGIVAAFAFDAAFDPFHVVTEHPVVHPVLIELSVASALITAALAYLWPRRRFAAVAPMHECPLMHLFDEPTLRMWARLRSIEAFGSDVGWKLLLVGIVIVTQTQSAAALARILLITVIYILLIAVFRTRRLPQWDGGLWGRVLTGIAFSALILGLAVALASFAPVIPALVSLRTEVANAASSYLGTIWPR